MLDLAVTETRHMKDKYLHPLLKFNKSTKSGTKAGDSDYMKLQRATKGTIRAVQLGVALAAMDGPLPVMDVIGLGVTMIYSAASWIDYFS
jgi:hypothetical protein